MSQIRFSPKLVAGIIVALFFGVALYLRIVLPYDQVFSGDWIKFTGVDAYYHMRIVDNLVYNFPHLNSFDPYMLYPSGTGIGSLRFFDYLLAGIIWLIGLGSPTQHTIDVVGVYFPAVLGALTVIPVYFIGKELFNRWVGVISAGLIAILPGEFLGRSILGFADHHVAETLFSTLVILFLILAIKAGRDREITFDHLWHGQWTTITSPLIYSLFAGIFLGIYLLTWMGALLFVFIISVYFIAQFIIDHLKGRSTDYLCFVGITTFIIALLMFLPTSPDKRSLASLIIAIFIPIASAALSRLIASRGIRPIFYPAALLGLGLASLAIFYIINPLLLKSMVGRLGIFLAWPMKTTVLEMQPLLLPGGDFTLSLAWGNFTTGFFLSFISLGILIYFIVKRGEADKTLLIVWSLVMLAATLSMRRFAYYFVVNVALLTGYLSWLILEFTGFKRLAAKPVETPRIVKKGRAKVRKRREGGFRITTSHVYVAFGVVVVFFLSFFPNISPAVATASHPRFAPSDAWCESLSWLRDNTPEPFGDPDFYYELYEPPPPGKSYSYPETAYGVVAWWDYGYWITRLGRRIPTANPGTGHKGEARIFAAQNEASANKLMDKYKVGSRYVIVDYAIVSTKFHAVATLIGLKNDYNPAWSPDGTKIAFASNRDGYWEIYVMDADGSAQGNLTNNIAVDTQPAWSPDGTKIAFVSDRDGNREIYVTDADGSAQGNLTNNTAVDTQPTWSPDGTKIAFVSNRDGNWEIYIMDADGSAQGNLTNNIAFDTQPAWSPDGTKIAFVSNRDGYWEIYVMDADGSAQGNLTNNIAFDTQPAWSPDGTKIAFVSDRDGNREIYVTDADGSAQGNLTNNTAVDRQPAWSPDGTKIAFVSDCDGNREIYVMDADGSAQGNLTKFGEFYDVYHYQPQEGGLEEVALFSPEYYRSLVVRLYNFDGREVIPQSSTVISFQEKVSPEGKTYKEIISAQSFSSYEEAEAYILSQELNNYKIVGTNPFISPVPLEALEHYKLIYSSDSSIMQPDVGAISEVKIFEYVGG